MATEGSSPSTPAQPALSTGTEEYTLPGVLYFLQDAFRDFEKERNEWQIEKSDLEVIVFNLGIWCTSNSMIYILILQ
jgi:striatin 1/3/4